MSGYTDLKGRISLTLPMLALAASVSASPVTPASYPTFAAEMAACDVFLVAELKEPHALTQAEFKTHPVKFEVDLILKGDQFVRLKQLVRTQLIYEEAAPGQRFLLLANRVDGRLIWSCTARLTGTLEEYLVKTTKLPADEKERYAFFQSHLQHPDEVVAQDAAGELDTLSHAQLRVFRDQMPHDSLVSWIKAKELPYSRRRLYLRMLGVCGNEQDVPMFAEEIRSAGEKARCLDGVIACYLALRGREGMKLVEDRFLIDPKANYADTYAAIVALRFHATDEQIIPREDVLHGLHCMLERPDLADLIIPDLARLEDWQQAERLAEMFKTADVKTSWLRVPVIEYLRACPLKSADKLLKECEELDPVAARRAKPKEPKPAPRQSVGQ